MAINPVDWNNAMTRTQDYNTIKHNEDTKGFVDQSNFQTSLKKEVDNKLSQVHKKDDTEYNQKKFDAKDKGQNEYSGNGGSKRKSDDNNHKQDGLKGSISHFDVQI